MMKSTFTFFFAILFINGFCQTTATFENYNLNPGNYLNDSSPADGFESGNIYLPNFNMGSYWFGWAISASTDATTPGFTNDYSAIAGGGVNGSNTYAVSANNMGTNTLHLINGAAGGAVEGLYITNSTYAYLSMLEGDAFAKKFGGEDGNDPDFFLLTIKKYLNGLLGDDSIDFYLADYRFTNNSQDYIVNEWTYLELTSLGSADSLLFTLTSSDVGMFGMNTPAYFCIDDVKTLDASGVKNITEIEGKIYPNPTSDYLIIDDVEVEGADFTILDFTGKIVQQGRLNNYKISLTNKLPGSYLLIINKNGAKYSHRFTIN